MQVSQWASSRPAETVLFPGSVEHWAKGWKARGLPALVELVGAVADGMVVLIRPQLATRRPTDRSQARSDHRAGQRLVDPKDQAGLEGSLAVVVPNYHMDPTDRTEEAMDSMLQQERVVRGMGSVVAEASTLALLAVADSIHLVVAVAGVWTPVGMVVADPTGRVAADCKCYLVVERVSTKVWAEATGRKGMAVLVG